MLLQPTTLAVSPAPLRSVLAFTSLPVLTALAGASVAAFRMPAAKTQSVIQHFAAGVVFAVVSVELLPDITRLHTLPSTIVGFTAGVALMLVLQRLTRGLESRKTAPARGKGRCSPSRSRPSCSRSDSPSSPSCGKRACRADARSPSRPAWRC